MRRITGNLCYENNKFIGPISLNENLNNLIRDVSYHETQKQKEFWESNEYKNPRFFLSLFEPSSIRLSDYNYISYYSYDEKAHIFALFSPQSKAKFILSEDTHDQYKPKLRVIIGKNTEKVYLISKTLNAKYKSGILLEYSNGSLCLFDRTKFFKSFVYLKCAKYQSSFPKIINLYDNGCTYLFEWDKPYACKNCVTQEIEYYEITKCKNGFRNCLFYVNEECSIDI